MVIREIVRNKEHEFKWAVYSQQSAVGFRKNDDLPFYESRLLTVILSTKDLHISPYPAD